MEPESKVLGATFDALDSVDSDQGPNRMRLTGLKWPQDFRLRHPPPMQVPLHLMHRLTLAKLMNLKSWHGGPAFDQLSSLASDPGPNQVHLINLQSWPWGPPFDSFAPLDSDPGPALMQRINLKVLASVGGGLSIH